MASRVAPQQPIRAHRESHRGEVGAEPPEQTVVAAAAAGGERRAVGVGAEHQAVVVRRGLGRRLELGVEGVLGELGEVDRERHPVAIEPALDALDQRAQALEPRRRLVAEIRRRRGRAVLDHAQQRGARLPRRSPIAPGDRAQERRATLRRALEQQSIERAGETDHHAHLDAVAELQHAQEEVEHLLVGVGAGRAEQLRAHLVVLAQPSRPLLLVAHAVAAVEEPQRQRQRRHPRRQHARQHRREVAAQGEQLAVAIDEAVELVARLAREQRLVGLEVVEDGQDDLGESALRAARRRGLLEAAAPLGLVEQERGDAGGERRGDPHDTLSAAGSASSSRPSSTGSSRPVISRN